MLQSLNNRDEFEKFFGRWGHVVVTSVYGGGSLELKVSSLGLDSSSRSMTDLKASLTAAISGVTFGANLNADMSKK